MEENVCSDDIKSSKWDLGTLVGPATNSVIDGIGKEIKKKENQRKNNEKHH